MRNNSDTSSPQSRLMQMLNQPVVVEPIQNILEKIQLQLITGLEEMAPPAYDFSELDKIFGKFQKNKVSTKSEYARLILDIVIYFIQTVKNVSINRDDYMRLEEETQEIQKKIREHIKIESRLKLQFDVRDRTINKLREENMRLKQENRNMKETINDLQKRLHQQLKIFLSKMDKNIKLDKHFKKDNQLLNNQKIHIKDPGEAPSPSTQLFNNKYEGQQVLQKYHEDFSKLLFDIRKQDTKQKRPHSLE